MVNHCGSDFEQLQPDSGCVWSSHPNWPIGNVSPGGFVSGVKRSFRERLTTSELRGAPPPGIFVFGPASPMASVSALSPASTVVSRRMAR